LFDHLQPTEIPTNKGIPAIPFPSWLLMEAILRELGMGDLTAGQGLWQLLDEKLEDKVNRIILCPDKAFALFPHHGAILQIDGNGKKESVLDHYEVVYLPQGTLNTAATAYPQLGNLLVFGTEGEELSSVGLANLCALAPDSVDIWHPNKKFGRPTESKSEATALTFLGHGMYDWEDPSQSFLGLLVDRTGKGFDDVITLKNFVDKIPSRLNSIVLAGCETGLPQITTQVSEFKGFAEDLLLRSNVPVIISTLWPVHRSSTILLVKQYHKFLLHSDSSYEEKSISPAAALRKAQLWLRGLNSNEVIKQLQALTAIQQSDQIADEIKSIKESIIERPYEHPYFWSTFYVTGGVN
jgi:hypothetical protein